MKNFTVLAILILSKTVSATDLADTHWTQHETELNAIFTSQSENELVAWTQSNERIQNLWNTRVIPTAKQYMEFGDQDMTRVLIDYEQGVVTVETLQPVENPSITVVKNKIKAIIASNIEPVTNSNTGKLSKEEISPTEFNSTAIINILVENKIKSFEIKGTDGVTRQDYKLTFNLVPNHIRIRAEKYRATVEHWAELNKLDPAFVMGIIRQESAFNPRAVSPAGAVGLMQIMPQYAGQEVLSRKTGHKITPNRNFLFDPNENIKIGTSYLKILRDEYFADISDHSKKLLLITCSYNWGPQHLRSALNKRKISTAISHDDLLSKLQFITPLETRDYLKKVRQYTAEFKGNNKS